MSMEPKPGEIAPFCGKRMGPHASAYTYVGVPGGGGGGAHGGCRDHRGFDLVFAHRASTRRRWALLRSSLDILFHRAWAARRAAAFLCAGLRARRVANPPSLPRSTKDGSVMVMAQVYDTCAALTSQRCLTAYCPKELLPAFTEGDELYGCPRR